MVVPRGNTPLFPIKLYSMVSGSKPVSCLFDQGFPCLVISNTMVRGLSPP
jgi:hypothetical protein